MNTNVADIRIEDYDYPLPDERIAKHPLQERDKCKLLVRKPDGTLSTRVFNELPALLPAQSLLIYNNTRVINARLRFRKPGGGAVIEIFCLEPDVYKRQAIYCMATRSIVFTMSRVRCSRCTWIPGSTMPAKRVTQSCRSLFTR